MLLKIGEAAKQAGVTVRTLQYYDKIGLLQPTGARSSGTRFYYRKDFLRLQKISALKSIGFSLEEISGALDSETFSLKDALIAHSERILHQMKILNGIKATLDNVIHKIENESDIHHAQSSIL